MQLLRNEVLIEVEEDGTWTETIRQTLKIQKETSAREVVLAVPSSEKLDKAITLEAWVWRAGRAVRKYRQNQWTDLRAIEPNAAQRGWLLVLSAKDDGDVVVGDVLAVEAKIRRANQIGHYGFCFSNALPQQITRLALTMPQGWRMQTMWPSGDGFEPVETESRGRVTRSWELRNSPAVKFEPWAPVANPHTLWIRLVPPQGSRAIAIFPALSTWPEVGRWLAQRLALLDDGGRELAETARSLTSGMSDSWTKISALANFVAKLRNNRVYQNDGMAWAYRPRPALDVLASGSGDCKEKACLMRALLEAVGYKAHLVLINTREVKAVQEDWPSLAQFDHMIVAIVLPPGVNHPLSVTHPRLGPLLIFDPASAEIPLGQLPATLRGKKALLCSENGDELMDALIPAADDYWQVETRTELQLLLGKDQAVGGRSTIRLHGQLAADERAATRSLSSTDRKARRASMLENVMREAAINAEQQAEEADGSVTLSLDFHARGIGELIGADTMMLNLNLAPVSLLPKFTEAARLQPVVIPPIHSLNETSINIPAGADVVGLPENQSVQSAYGRYDVRYSMTDSRVTLRRELVLQPLVVAPLEYTQFRQFVEDVARADRMAFLLRFRQP